MVIHYYKEEMNFGDAINPWFWQHWLEKDFSNESNDLLVGIGTLINDRIPENYQTVHIMGSGAGYGRSIPKVRENWKVHCVRGPLTAEKLELNPDLAIADPAILINEMVAVGVARKNNCGFMPHISIDSPRFREMIESMGLVYISPQSDRDTVIAEVDGCERLICSAMHGAILAEALRVPWFPVSTSKDILNFKWHDWMQSMGIDATLTPVTSIWREQSQGMFGKIKAEARRIMLQNQLKKIISREKFLLAKDPLFQQRKEQLKCVFNKFSNEYGN